MDAMLRLCTTLSVLAHERTARLRDDRGQGTIEYVGMIVVAALIVVAVMSTDMGDAISGKFTESIQSVLDG